MNTVSKQIHTTRYERRAVAIIYCWENRLKEEFDLYISF